jgi:Tfp pilus assembly protein PilO
MSSSNRIVVAMLAVVALAIAFWVLLLSPKKSEVAKLEDQAAKVNESLAVHRSEVAQGLAAERRFPAEYQQLVVLGKAAPADSETASLLVQLNRIAARAHVEFQTFKLESGGAGGEEPAAAEPSAPEPETGEGGAPSYPSATEVAASTLPLGASIGPAGLAVMPYSLTFHGSFAKIANFIHGLDALVKTKNAQVDVTGRLITINSFSLSPKSKGASPDLEGSFSVATYLVPPGEGVTAGATPTSPEASTSTQVAATTGGTP